MSEAEEKGLALFAEIYGPKMADGTRALYEKGEAFGTEQSRWTMEWSFGSIWTREGLERKMRSCAVLGMLIGRGASEEIKYHTRMGIKNGLTTKELEEVFYTAIPYCGFPAAANAKRAMLAAFEEIEREENNT